jgi:ligand-binding sensor domain-containing protein
MAETNATDAGGIEPRWREASVWRQPEGLPQDSVLRILETRDGYIWVGTRGGLSRFDGVRFTSFDDRNKAQLRENEVWGLVEADDGGLWIGIYGGGLSRLKDGHFTVYTQKDGLVDDFVRDLALDAGGALWIGTEHGVSRLKDGRFTTFAMKEGPGVVRALLPEPDGSVSVAIQDGIQRIVNDRIEAIRLPGMEKISMGIIEALCRDREGALWIGAGNGLYRVADGATTRYTTADGLSSNAIRRLHVDGAGRLWIATSAGLDRYMGKGSRLGLFTNEAAATDFTALHSDHEGGLWVGHRGAGLARFHQGIFSTYTSHDGLPDSEVTAVLPGIGGISWVGTFAGMSVFHQGRFTTLAEANGLPRGPISALAEDKTGYLWVGTTNSGLYRSVEPVVCTEQRCDPRFRPLRDDPVFEGQARVILEDRSGAIWIGTDRSGLARYERGVVTRYTTASGLSNDAIRALAEGRDGSLWIGTKGGGLARLKDGAFTTFTEKDGLPNNSVQALYMDPDETLWIATRQGLSRYKGGRFTIYSTKDGLYWSHAYAFVEDDEGKLWMSSGKGIFHVSKRQLDDFAEGRIHSIVSTAYGREHGLPSTMAAVSTYPGAAKSADGRLWFAVVGGLAVADPKRLPTNTVAPPVQIEEVQIDGHSVNLKAPAEAPPGRGEFMFRYTALSYEAPQAVRFKYRLEGFDRDWVDADTRRVAYYTNLPPGRYRFRAIAANSDGVWNARGAEIGLSLAPHFYETRWFYAVVGLGLIMAAAAAQRLSVRRLQRRERDLRARVDEAVAQVKVLSGLLPICASCKRIRDETGSWSQMEQYIHTHSEAEFSHGICPECAEEIAPGLSQRIRDGKKEPA